MLLFPPRHESPQPNGTSRAGATRAEPRRILTRGIYRAGTRTPKSRSTISQNRGSCAFPEPLREMRDPTFAHDAAVRVPKGLPLPEKGGMKGKRERGDSGYKRRRNRRRKREKNWKGGKHCQIATRPFPYKFLTNTLNPNYIVFP